MKISINKQKQKNTLYIQYTLVWWDAQGTEKNRVTLKRSISAEKEVHGTGKICFT